MENHKIFIAKSTMSMTIFISYLGFAAEKRHVFPPQTPRRGRALCHRAATGQTALDGESGTRWVARGEDQPCRGF